MIFFFTIIPGVCYDLLLVLCLGKMIDNFMALVCKCKNIICKCDLFIPMEYQRALKEVIQRPQCISGSIGNWKLEILVVVLMERGINWCTWRRALMFRAGVRTNGKLNPHMGSTLAIEPGHIGGRQPLLPLRAIPAPGLPEVPFWIVKRVWNSRAK